MPMYVHLESAADQWNTLKNLCQGKEDGRVWQIIQQLINTTSQKDRPVDEKAQAILNLQAELKGIDKLETDPEEKVSLLRK